MRSQRDSLCGFTLVEILVVIAIIGILAALLLPVVARAKASGDQTTCLNNMRQIGAGISSYTADHDGYYPGPLEAGQTIYYDENMVQYFIYPYMGGGIIGTTASTGPITRPPEAQLAPYMVCPGWMRYQIATNGYEPKPGQQKINYIFANDLPGGMNPFGYPTQGTYPRRVADVAQLAGKAMSTSGGAAGTTMDTNNNNKIIDPNFGVSTTIMMTEADQVSWKFDTTAGWYGSLPKTHVHTAARNAIYWDYHAEGRPLNYIPYNP